MDGFVKWQRCCLDNDIWRHDQTAWHVFEYFWGVVDYRTGKTNKAYRTISEYLDMPLSTIHKAINRLVDARMVNAKVNANYTTFSIVNWHKYQGHGERLSERKVNAKGTQSEHIIRNKEIKKILSKDNSEKSQDKRNKDLQELIDHSNKLNFVLQGTLQENRFSAYNLLKKHGLEKSKRAVDYAVGVRGKPYAPTINDFTSLYRKIGDLINFYQKEKNEQASRKPIIG